VNTPLSDLDPFSPVKNVDVTADHALISQVPTNGKPAPTKPSGIQQRFDQTEPHTPPDTTDSDDENPLSIVHGIVHADSANSRRIPSIPDAHVEGYGPEAAEWHIKVIAEVA